MQRGTRKQAEPGGNREATELAGSSQHLRVCSYCKAKTIFSPSKVERQKEILNIQ